MLHYANKKEIVNNNDNDHNNGLPTLKNEKYHCMKIRKK